MGKRGSDGEELPSSRRPPGAADLVAQVVADEGGDGGDDDHQLDLKPTVSRGPLRRRSEPSRPTGAEPSSPPPNASGRAQGPAAKRINDDTEAIVFVKPT